MSKPAPGRIVGQNRRQLSEPENKDEFEEQLKRRHPLLALDMLLAYDRTLTRRRGEAARAVSARTRTLSAAPGVRTDPEVDDG